MSSLAKLPTACAILSHAYGGVQRPYWIRAPESASWTRLIRPCQTVRRNVQPSTDRFKGLMPFTFSRQTSAMTSIAAGRVNISLYPLLFVPRRSHTQSLSLFFFQHFDYLCALSVTVPRAVPERPSLQSHSFELCTVRYVTKPNALSRSGLMTADFLSGQTQHIYRFRNRAATQTSS
jgi:hypothetical protein